MNCYSKKHEVKDKVLDILRLHPKARDNDEYLYLRVLMALGIDTNMTLREYMEAMHCCKLPKYTAVTRIRRYWQNIYPELKGSASTLCNRLNEEEEYRQLYGKGNSICQQ